MEKIRIACHDTNVSRLRFILETYQEYKVSWEKSNCKPSQMVALSLKAFLVLSTMQKGHFVA
jgi:hypothetical protein